MSLNCIGHALKKLKLKFEMEWCENKFTELQFNTGNAFWEM